MAIQSAPKKRPTCPTCSRPVPLCLCARIESPSLQNPVSITILQHSREEKHALNTARIAKLGFKNLTVASVSDVISGARIVLHSLKPHPDAGFFENPKWVSGVDASSLGIGGRSLQIQEDSGALGDVDLGRGFRLENEVGGVGGSQNRAQVTASDEEPLLTIALSSGGDISSMTHRWTMAEATTQLENPKFDQILDNPEAVGALAKGFVVKKLQKKPLLNGRRSGGFQELQEFEEFRLAIPPGSVLLFPNQRSVGVVDIGFEVKHLIVLDGTWRKAKRMYAENPWLQLLPHLRLDSETVSLYAEVRRQPRAGYLSTIESIVYALKAVGKNVDGLDNLLDVLASMVGDQRRCKDERLSKISQTA